MPVLLPAPPACGALYRPTELWTLTRASRIPPPFALLLRGNPKQNQNRTLVKNIYTRTAQPARLPGELTIGSSFDVHLFCSLHYWGVCTCLDLAESLRLRGAPQKPLSSKPVDYPIDVVALTFDVVVAGPAMPSCESTIPESLYL
jgi:hypothetical protein